MLLGQLVDVVAREARTHLEGYLRAARPPALRLLGLYSLQVGTTPRPDPQPDPQPDPTR